MPQQLFDASYDLDVGGFVKPPFGSITSWFQLWKPVFPLPQHVGGHASQRADFRNPVSPVFCLGEHIESCTRFATLS